MHSVSFKFCFINVYDLNLKLANKRGSLAANLDFAWQSGVLIRAGAYADKQA
jgi:hypothetical protein